MLIPRPETEHVVEVALARLGARRGDRLSVADVGTGSGCLAVALARELPHAQIVATDISPSALEVARRNAKRHGVAARIEFCQTNLLRWLSCGSRRAERSLRSDREQSALRRPGRSRELAARSSRARAACGAFWRREGAEIYAPLIAQAAGTAARRRLAGRRAGLSERTACCAAGRNAGVVRRRCRARPRGNRPRTFRATNRAHASLAAHQYASPDRRATPRYTGIRYLFARPVVGPRPCRNSPTSAPSTNRPRSQMASRPSCTWTWMLSSSPWSCSNGLSFAASPSWSAGSPTGAAWCPRPAMRRAATGFIRRCRCAPPGRLCPHAVFLEGRHDLYAEWSDRVAAILAQFSPVVEMASIDEAYLDLSGTERLHGPPLAAAHALIRTIGEKTRLPCSAGLARTRLVAKVASDQAKPRGLVWVPAGAEAQFLAPLGVRRIPGIGKVTEAALRGLGLEKVGQLAAVPLDRLDAFRASTMASAWLGGTIGSSAPWKKAIGTVRRSGK